MRKLHTHITGSPILAGVWDTLISFILAAGSHVARSTETLVTTRTIVNTSGTILAY